MPSKKISRRRVTVICIILFLTAFGIRLLSWQDTRLEVGKVQTYVTDGYKQMARLLLSSGVTSFLSSSSPLSDPVYLGHPPGYPILLAVIFGLVGESDAAPQFVQITCDAAAAVVIFLITVELLSPGVAITGGALVALAPQFTRNSTA